jgi:hypothetical protein
MKYEIRKLCDSEALRLACRTIVFNEKLLTTYETMRVDDGRRKSHTPNLKTVLPNNIAKRVLVLRWVADALAVLPASTFTRTRSISDSRFSVIRTSHTIMSIIRWLCLQLSQIVA